MNRFALKTLILILVAASAAWAGCNSSTIGTNTGSRQTSTDTALGCAVFDLYGPGGLTLPNPTHHAHFSNESQANLTPLNAALGTELTLLPLASPASGYTFTFDRAAGVYTRSSQTFGPILAERAETIGRGKVFFGFTFQHYNFDTIDSFDLHNFPAVFGHEAIPSDPEFEKDIIFTQNSINLSINQSTFFATFGVTNRLDISVAVPIVDASIDATSNASIIRVAAPIAGFQSHYFDVNNPDTSTQKVFTNSSSKTGIGDVTFRGKGTLWKNETSGIALGADLRLPTGDERNFLGSGAIGFKPFLAASTRLGPASPHVNLGYQWNGDSLLAGNIATDAKASLPDQFFWTLGADVRVVRPVTLALDVLGQRVVDAPRLISQTFHTLPSTLVTNSLTFPDIATINQSFNIVNGSVGVKVSLGHNYLATANVLIKLNDGGLRDKYAPLFGISKTF